MASAGQSEGHDDPLPASSSAESPLKARLNRKRTKTGCLTCRKRRIKCGEERPICRNCIKSKRLCEGYNQRVVFKPPAFDFHPARHGGAHITFQAGPTPGPASAHQLGFVYPAADAASFSQLRPRPVEQFVPPFGQPFQQYAQGQSDGLQLQHIAPHHRPVAYPVLPQTQYQQPPPAASNAVHVGERLDFAWAEQDLPQRMMSQVPYGNGNHLPTVSPTHPALTRPGAAPSTVAVVPASSSGYTSPLHDKSIRGDPVYQMYPKGVATTHPWSPHAQIPRPELSQPINYHPAPPTHPLTHPTPHVSTATTRQPSTQTTPDCYEHETYLAPNLTPEHWLSQAAVEVQDDDYYDMNPDEDVDIDASDLNATEEDRQGILSGILRRNHISIQELQVRRYDTFLYHGMLDHYRVEEVASPLRNPATARVFAHFISVTGPSLSIFERHPRNTSVLFTEGHVPLSQRGLWTYTMPMAALRHQGLLHAMLALASLHISRLTGASPTPSMQHYAWALKRVHHCVGHPKKRLELTTIAASMLLGFFEIMTADHVKWNTHLMGSKQLFIETDFVAMTQQFRRLKMERARQWQYQQRRPSTSSLEQAQDDILDQIPDVDERVVSNFVGRVVRYGDHGQVGTAPTTIPQELDLSRFEMLRDLYWWYCKQDTFQSIISGNPLLMEYSRWANCPPRAPLGKPDAIYGSFDHLILLLARIADFSASDRARKLKQIEANGGQWRPAPGMKIPRPPQQGRPPTSATDPSTAPKSTFPTPPAPAPPTYYGMAPPPREHVQMPASYGKHDPLPTQQSAAPQDSIDLQRATQAALEEHGRILAALDLFSQSLGPAFEPLPPELQPVQETPFGPAIFYRAYDISCLWATYTMARMIAIRAHPHMPPAAHMAAGVAAPQTKSLANEIGRIVAGIAVDTPDKPVNPSLGAALCESCMPSFFAAVQYHDAAQRHHTVMRIFSIARRTGWGTAEVIANGCETLWVRTAAMGRGPPYTRVVRNMRPQYSDDPRLNGSWESLDPHAMPDEEDEADRRLIKVKPGARLNWAIGIMGTEEDISSMN